MAIGLIRWVGLDLRHPTLKGHSRTGDPRHRDLLRRQAGDAALFKLADAIRHHRRTGIHRLGLGKGHQLNHQLAVGLHIQQGVLQAAIGAVIDVDHQGWRVITDHLKEAERRQVADALSRLRGNPGNRPRGNGRRQPAVAFKRREGLEIQLHQRPARDSRI